MKLVVISGGSGSIGKQIVQKFAHNGWNIAIISRSYTRANDVANSITNLTTKVIGKSCDFSAPKPVNVFKEIEQEMGMKMTCFINAAGINCDSLLVRMKSSMMQQLLNVNLLEAMYANQAAVDTMLRNRKYGHRSIIQLGSIVGSDGNSGQCVYSASKSGLVGFTKSLAKEIASKQICVNLIEPGFIESEMTSHLNKSTVVDKIPLRRLGTPLDVANMALFLASKQASYMTGQVFRVDGGLTL